MRREWAGLCPGRGSHARGCQGCWTASCRCWPWAPGHWGGALMWWGDLKQNVNHLCSCSYLRIYLWPSSWQCCCWYKLIDVGGWLLFIFLTTSYFSCLRSASVEEENLILTDAVRTDPLTRVLPCFNRFVRLRVWGLLLNVSQTDKNIFCQVTIKLRFRKIRQQRFIVYCVSCFYCHETRYRYTMTGKLQRISS